MHLYYGKKLRDTDSSSGCMYGQNEHSSARTQYQRTVQFHLIHWQWNYPCMARVISVIRLSNWNLRMVDGFGVYVYRPSIGQRKAALTGLPATYVESHEEAETLVIELEDYALQASKSSFLIQPLRHLMQLHARCVSLMRALPQSMWCVRSVLL